MQVAVIFSKNIFDSVKPARKFFIPNSFLVCKNLKMATSNLDSAMFLENLLLDTNDRDAFILNIIALLLALLGDR